jgi:hypothetical protein
VAASLKVIVFVSCRNTHDLPPELPKSRPLLWFGVDVRPHLVGWTMLNNDLVLINFVLNIEILYLNVLYTFSTTCFALALMLS